MISICIPCMNRTHDLKETMPHLVTAANASPPVEIAVLDYNSQDDLAHYMGSLTVELAEGNEIGYRKYTGRDHFHMAHARNLAMLAGAGEYLMMLSTDIGLYPDCITGIREKFKEGYELVHHSDTFVGVVCLSRQEFVAAGGFDERFEFYGKEDKELMARLKRRGLSSVQVPDRLSLIYTPWPEKRKNYRLDLSRREISKRSMAIYTENMENELLVANEGKEWGSWE